MPPSAALVVLLYVSGAPASSSVGAGGESGARTKLVEALRRGGSDVVSGAVDRALAARREGWRTMAELDFFTRGRVALEHGRRARDRVELDEAIRRLAEAEAIYAEGLELPGTPSLMAEAALERGLALAELGRTDDARAAFRRALALMPGLALTERVARPDVVKLFKDVSRAPAKAAVVRRFTVAGAVTAPEIQVHIDGIALPNGELSASLSPGFHLVRAEREGVSVARLVEIDEANDTAIDLPAPVDAVMERIASLRNAPSEPAVRALIGALDVGGALVGALAVDQRHAVVSRVTSECVTSAVAIDVSTDESLRKGLATLDAEACRQAPLAVTIDDPRLQPVQVVAVAPAAKPRRKIWPWVFAGALGVTAAIVGVTVGVVASDPRYSVHLDGHAFGAR